jgi:chemotaxis protein methyltransferase CheR
MKSSNQTLSFFSDYIFKQLGIVYRDSNYYQLDTRLQEIAHQLGFSGPDALHAAAAVTITPQMKMLILDIATNNETLFFRDPFVFISLEKEVLTPILNGNGSANIKIWSAACSYGQEPYTLAMVLEGLKQRYPNLKYEITATDISDRALSAAKAGIYSQLQIQRGLPAPMLVKHFKKQKRGEVEYDWEVNPELKKHISFKKLNLTEPFGVVGPFDVVLCRNVLIYQSVEGKRDIIKRIYERLNPGGVLIMGAAESMLGVSDSFEMMRLEKVTFFRRPFQQKKTA